MRVDIRECLVQGIFIQRIDLLVNSADAFERETGAATVLSDADQIAAASPCDEHEASPTAAHSDDSSRHNDFVEPAHDHFHARLWKTLKQTAARARETLKAPRHGGRKMASGLVQSLSNAPLALVAL